MIRVIWSRSLGCGALVVASMVFVPRAEAVAPGSVGPGTTGYTVTFAARVCDEYTDVFANRARNNIMESLRDLGPDTNYLPGERISPAREMEAPQDACRPLVGWEFAMGRDYVGGSPADLSNVVNAFPTAVVTQPFADELDANGNDTGRDIAAAVNIELDAAQLDQARRSDLWVQGAEITAIPALAAQYGFAALRCAVDNLNGDNVEFVAFPANVRHVFCFAYYVQPPPTSATIVVCKQLLDDTGNHTFGFGGNVSYNPGGAFTIDVVGGGPTCTEYIRGASTDGFAWVVTEIPTAGWALSPASPVDGFGGGPACVSQLGTSVVTPTAAASGVPGSASIDLAAADVVTCTFTNERFPTGGLAVHKRTTGGVGDFAFTIDPPGPTGPTPFTATVTEPGVPVAVGPAFGAAGTYVITETLPADAPGGTWALADVVCNGTSRAGDLVEVAPGTWSLAVVVAPDEAVDCEFLDEFTPLGSVTIHKTAAGGVGTFWFLLEANYDPIRYLDVLPPIDVDCGGILCPEVTVDDVTPGLIEITGLPLGSYTATELAPAPSAAGVWQSELLSCNGDVTIVEPGVVVGELTLETPDIECFVHNVLLAPGSLAVRKRLTGETDGRTGAVEIEVVCADGTTGNLTVAPGASGTVGWDEPLEFLAPTTCSVTETATGVAPGAQVTRTIEVTVDGVPAPGGEASVDVEVGPGSAVVVTVIDAYIAAPTATTIPTTPAPTTAPAPPPATDGGGAIPPVATNAPGELPATGGRTVPLAPIGVLIGFGVALRLLVRTRPGLR